MIKKQKEWFKPEFENKVGRPKLAKNDLVKAAKIEAVMAFVLCLTIALSGAGILTQKSPLELLGINNKGDFFGNVAPTEKIINKTCPEDYVSANETTCKKIEETYAQKTQILKADGIKCFDKKVVENKSYNGVIYRNGEEEAGRYCYDKYFYVDKCPKDHYKFGSRCRKTVMYVTNKICPASYKIMSESKCELIEKK